MIDTAAHTTRPEMTLSGPVIEFELTPDRQFALALVENAVVILNGTTGELVGTAAGFKHPSHVVFGGTNVEDVTPVW